MADIEEKRTQVLSFDSSGEWSDQIEEALEGRKPELNLARATTKEAALEVIREQGKGLQAVVANLNLRGTDGSDAYAVARNARGAGVPNVAILTASPQSADQIDGVMTWSKSADLTWLLSPRNLRE